ncbi:dienelactone hydrolase family protein [Kribbella sp. NPDC051620]|uniref:dienelactone hydrolase family protein n=1 Tax=Kribbella sp. NPDC051620 TaxID=3364120 RepID=UPI00378AF6A8
MTFPRIDLLVAPPDATDLVLLVHGGQESSREAAGAWRAAILRMWPFAVAARAGAPGAAVGMMRDRYRGWNGPDADPVADLRVVLDRLPARITRVQLVGHSMGGRAVVAVGNHPLVDGVLALAPWLPGGEPLVPMRGPVVFAHGTADRITSPAQTAAYARRLRASGVPVALLSVADDDHTMLRRSPDWNALVRDFAAGTTYKPSLDPDHVDQLPHSKHANNPLRGVLDIARARLTLRIVGQL